MSSALAGFYNKLAWERNKTRKASVLFSPVTVPLSVLLAFVVFLHNRHRQCDSKILTASSVFIDQLLGTRNIHA